MTEMKNTKIRIQLKKDEYIIIIVANAIKSSLCLYLACCAQTFWELEMNA